MEGLQYCPALSSCLFSFSSFWGFWHSQVVSFSMSLSPFHVHRATPSVTSNLLPCLILIWISFPFPLKFGKFLLKNPDLFESWVFFVVVVVIVVCFACCSCWFYSGLLKDYFLTVKLKYPVVHLCIGVRMTACNVLHQYSFCFHFLTSFLLC